MNNKVILVGRLTRDPEVRFTQSGKAVASFSLAVQRRFVKNNSQQNVDFVPIIAWEKLADISSTHFQKGSQIQVEGHLQIRNYDAQDGSKRFITEVIAETFEFLNLKPHGNNTDNPEIGGAASFGEEVLPDEEIPF